MKRTNRVALARLRGDRIARVRRFGARVVRSEARRLRHGRPALRVARRASASSPRTADDPTAKATIYIPSAYQVATPDPGTKLGDVTATASAADLAGAVLPLTGELDAIAPTAATNAAAQAMRRHADPDVGPAPDRAGQTLDIPMFVVAGGRPRGRGRLLDEARRLPAAAGRACRHTGPRDLRREAALGDVHVVGDHRARRAPATTAGRRSGRRTPPARASRTPRARSRCQSLRHIPATVKLTVTKKKVTRHARRSRARSTSRSCHTLVRFSSRSTWERQPRRHRDRDDRRGRQGRRCVRLVHPRERQVGTIVKVTAVVDSDSGVGRRPGQTANRADLYYHDLGASACTAVGHLRRPAVHRRDRRR